MMRVVLDMQGAQTASLERGIGRYTLDFVRALAQRPDELDLILLLNGAFGHTVQPITRAFEDLLPSNRICVWQPPFTALQGSDVNQIHSRAAALVREAFVQTLQPDLVHVCSWFEGYHNPAVVSVGQFDQGTPVSVTLHDLIPLVYPQHYLPDSGYSAFYEERLTELQKVTCLLAISEATRQEALPRLAFAPDRLFVTSCGVDPMFRPALESEKAKLEQVLRSLRITQPYVLYVGSADPRKNLNRLVQAYAALPPDLRNSHQLVMAGPMTDEELLDLRSLAASLGLERHAYRLLGHVANEQLLALYQGCKAFVFPSWAEGFGLPLLEAMACGAPSIASNIPSLSEIKHSQVSLFDPFDVSQMSAFLARILSDEPWRTHLCERDTARATEFSWTLVAQRAIEAWKSLVVPPPVRDRVWASRYTHQQSVQSQLLDSLADLYAEVPEEIAKQDAGGLAASCAINESELLRRVRAEVESSNQTWRLEGPFDSSYSLALVNRELARALSAIGKTVALHSTEGPGDFEPSDTFLKANPDLEQIHRACLALPALRADVVSRNLYPPRVSDMHGRLNCLHAYAWEETGFPQAWINAFNESLQGITVTSAHVQKVLIDQGLRAPVVVCGLGTDHWATIEPEPVKVHSDKSFRFLHVSSCFPRKGVEVMLRAYGAAFRRSDDVVLIIKTFHNPHNDVYEWLHQCRQADPTYPDVEVLEADWPESQVKGLMQSCHALVAPSHAEGFGLPMAEAMMSGLPVITTAWGGQTDFCTPDSSYLIDYTFEHAKSHFELFGSVWAKPDERHLATLFREVYEAPIHERERRVEAGRARLRAQFLWQHCAERVVHATRQFEQVISMRHVSRIAWISTWATRCGIATYSEHLLACMTAEVTVLANQVPPDELERDDSTERCWQADGKDDLRDLANAVAQTRANIVVVQFNYGLFNFDHFARFVDEQVDLGRTVVVCLHSTLDPEHQPEKRLRTLVSALSRCARVLVHTVHDLNRLKQLGMTQNVTLFPQGVWVPDHEQPKPSSKHQRRRFRLATYGFMLPHKGLVEMIKALSLLNRRGVQIELLMCNAYYPDPVSIRTTDAVRQAIREERMQRFVELDTRFQSDAASLSRLATADLIVYPYQQTNESSSGAIRFGLASGVPVAVTPMEIFDDVRPVVYTLPGFDPQSIADGIERLLWQRQKQTDAWQATNLRATQWTAQHDFRLLGKRLQNMLQALTLESRLRRD